MSITKVELPERMVDTGMLAVDRFHASPDNPRQWKPTDQRVKDMALSLEKGQIHPIAARPHPELEEHFEVRAGHCRLEAARLLGWEMIRAEIFDWDDDEAFLVTMEENHERTDLTPLEEARLCQRALERFDMETASAKLGHSDKWVRRRASLSRLCDAWTEELESNPLFAGWTVGHLEVIAKLDPDAQEVLLSGLIEDSNKEHYFYDASAMTIKDLRRKLATQVASLDRCPWLAMDLEPQACTDCLKRSSKSPLLPNLLDDDTGGDECLDAECFQAKALVYLREEIPKWMGRYEGLHAALPRGLAGFDERIKLEKELGFDSFNSWGFDECEEVDDGAEPVLVFDGWQPVLQWWRKRQADSGGGVSAASFWVLGMMDAGFDEDGSREFDGYPVPFSAEMGLATTADVCEAVFHEVMCGLQWWFDGPSWGYDPAEVERSVDRAKVACDAFDLDWSEFEQLGAEEYPDEFAEVLALDVDEAAPKLVDLGLFEDRHDAIVYVTAAQKGGDWRENLPAEEMYDRCRECCAALDAKRGLQEGGRFYLESTDE